MDNQFILNSQKFNEFIDTLSQHVSDNPNKIREAYEYFKSADADIKVAELLYNIKINSLAIFHLQQATEKILDGIGYMSGYISLDEIKTSHHVTPNIYYKLIYRVLSAVLDMNEVEEEFSEKKEDAAKLPSEEIKEIITKCNGEEINTLIIQKTQPNIPNFLKEARKRGRSNKLNFSKIRSWTKAFEIIVMLSRVLYPHEAYTRYPDNNIKPSDYNESKLGVAQNIEELIKLSKSSNDEVKSFINSLCQKK